MSFKTHSQLLDYKVSKVIRMIRKIKDTLSEEGLDQRQLPKFIRQSIELNSGCEKGYFNKSSVFEHYTVYSLTQNSNKFIASMLLTLSQTYQDLLSRLEDKSNSSDFRKMALSKQTGVKLEQNIPSIQQNREPSNIIKIQEGVDAQNQNTYSYRQTAIQQLKKQYQRKNKSMRKLHAHYNQKQISKSKKQQKSKKHQQK